MTTFSFGGAVGAGFGVIARNPLAFLAWCAVYLVVALGPLALMAATLWPQFSALAALAEAEVDPDSPAATQQMMSLMGQINALSLLQWATSLASSALIVGAVFRAVLEPQNRRWFFLRLGRQEFWLALCLVVVVVVAGLLAALSMFPVMITSLVLVAAGPTQTLTPGVGLGIGAMVLIALGAMLWLFVRFSLGLPMSFAGSYFRLFESWTLTRGHAAKMALVGVAVSLLATLVQIAVFVGFIFAAVAMLQPTAEFDVTTLTFAQVAPILALAAVLMALVSVFGTVLYSAPLAQIYRQLAQDPSDA
ncbi:MULTISPECIES: hypothetical protein [unclassified Phenylobacterium]|uniref:hypothetical protein n=1 Tax=unclassified Phenylobacterium TaxID=2640670 RepID=UPI0022B37FC0|nr:hypothetical protein [Phenylobacterium sp. NIBR 498073]MBS0488395.1 hypothetical protein [Pseudomonadota bacterium]WGU40823.1 hypothetical protein O4N75_03630 [Phenylobacterium sp. NIBR 498073]